MAIPKIVCKKMLPVNLALLFSISNVSGQKTVRYDLYVRDTLVNFTGKLKRAIAVNGQIPMPALVFTEGDTAEIMVHNELNENTALHWHGVFVPNKEDGVPYLTQSPIRPHSEYLYRFPVIQSGTHWYHSHSELQEQIGMYGSMIFLKKNNDETFRKGIDDLPAYDLVISDWSNMRPEDIHRRLHGGSDWFALRKGSVQSFGEAIRQGYLKTKLQNEWKRMTAMDVSDVAYDRFLMNGKDQYEIKGIFGGEKVRLRIANAGAATNFWLSYAGGKITVVANDGNDVEPVEVDRLLIAISETYDVIVTLPADSTAYQFLATAEDRTGTASAWLGQGIRQLATPLHKLKYFEGMKMMNGMMRMNGELQDQGMKMSLNQMDMNAVMYPEITGEAAMGSMHNGDDSMQQNNNPQPEIVTLNYAMLRSPVRTDLPAAAPVRALHFDLTGNMSRYVWALDNKTVSETDRILIRKGEKVRMILSNASMMRHPMHLHGHDFRLLNGQGDYAPLKNIVDIMPMETDTLEFAADKSGDWFFHCHILYHMMSGMGRIFSYINKDSTNDPDFTDPKKMRRKLFADDRMPHFMIKAGFEINGSDGEAMMANTRWKAAEMWHMGYHAMHGYESETTVGRYFGKMQWWFPYIGFDYHYKMEGSPQKGFFDMEHSPRNLFGNKADERTMFGQTSNKNNRHTFVAGIAYTLPTLTIADLRIDGNGKIRLQFSRENIAVTPRIRFSWMLNTDNEYMAGFRYILGKNISVSTHYDSDMGWGIGVTLNN